MSRFEMNEDLMKKLEREESLTASEVFELEQSLESEGSEVVRDTVSALPDMEPSLAWRSELNEKLAAMRPEASAKKPWWSSRWLVGGLTTVTAGIAVIALVVVPGLGQDDVTVPPGAVVTTGGSVTPPDGVVGDTDDLGIVLIRAHEVAVVEANSGIQVPRRAVEQGYDWDSLNQ